MPLNLRSQAALAHQASTSTAGVQVPTPEPSTSSLKQSAPFESLVLSRVEYFRELSDKALFTRIIEQTNLYATQKDVGSNLHIEIEELEQFIGMIFHSLATVRTNRVPDNGMPSDTTLKKTGPDSYAERMASCQDVKLTMVKWMDNRVVNLLSNFVGAYPETSVKRFDRRTK
ncbi:hypothetical protein Trydic_g7833 [Trypoxylus dichotomus]